MEYNGARKLNLRVLTDQNARTLDQIYHSLGSDFKLRFANRMYILIIEKDSVGINMVMQPMVVGGQPQLIYNPERYTIQILDKNEIILFLDGKKEIFRMNFDAYAVDML